MLEGKHFYIELKTVARPARSTTMFSVGLRREQKDWHERYRAAGGLACYILVQVGSGRGGRYLIDSEHSAYLFEYVVDEDWLRKHSYTTDADGPSVVCAIAAEP
jgi:hypothetical protein